METLLARLIFDKENKIMKRYVVGYPGKDQCVYGQDTEGKPTWADPMGLREAKQYAQYDMTGEIIIFELVEKSRITIKTK